MRDLRDILLSDLLSLKQTTPPEKKSIPAEMLVTISDSVHQAPLHWEAEKGHTAVC
jgi:hypothetical protein